MSDRLVVDLTDGTSTVVPLTAAEDQERAATDAARQDREDQAAAAAAAAAATETATRLAARLTVVDKVRADVLDDATVAQLAGLFPAWEPDLTVAVGEVYQWDGTLVECIQAHTTQADWTPDITPSLWKVHRTDDGTGPATWQPGITVETGEPIIYDAVGYTVVQGHTTQAGWEPPTTPSLFAPVV